MADDTGLGAQPNFGSFGGGGGGEDDFAPQPSPVSFTTSVQGQVDDAWASISPNIRAAVRSYIADWARALGLPVEPKLAAFSFKWENTYSQQLRHRFWQIFGQTRFSESPADEEIIAAGSEIEAQRQKTSFVDVSGTSAEGLYTTMLQLAGDLASPDFPGLGEYIAFLSSGGQAGGGGVARINPADTLDLKSLEEQAQEIWRGTLLQEAPNAMQLAKTFQATVRNNPNVNHDFGKFVLDRARSTSRYDYIYKDKPESQNEAEYLGPFVAAARQFINPTESDEIAARGAALGGSPGGFSERLRRHRDVQNTPRFISSLQDRVSRLSGVFRG